jgi:DHA3 family macrolide efflux protein-like MFS transporter
MLEQQTVIEEEQQSLKGYFAFWIGQLFSMLGSSIVFFSIMWWVTIETKSAVFLGMAAAISFIPNLIVIPIAGTLVDRWDRKKTILIADLGQALTTLYVIISFTFVGPNIWLIILMNSLRGFFQNFHQPAVAALPPLMIPKEKLTRVNGITNMSSGLIRIIGPFVGAIFLAFMTIEQVMWIDIITFLIAASLLWTVKIPKIRKQEVESKNDGELQKVEKSPFWSEFKQGFKTMRETPGLLTLATLCTFVNFLLIPVNILLSLFVYDPLLHSGTEMNFAFVMGLMQIGVIIGSLITSIKKKWKNRQLVVLVTGIFMFVGNIVSAIAPPGNFLIIGIGRFILGANISIGIVMYFTILQISVPLSQQGRVFSIDTLISMAITPIAMLIAGPLSELIGIVNMFIIFSILGIIANFAVWFLTGLVKVDYDKIHEELEKLNNN